MRNLLQSDVQNVKKEGKNSNYDNSSLILKHNQVYSNTLLK
uniref:Uncharacterized protein n=1 Tax=Anguilla anguilla TaxID=7936 RepID=A0A0E9RXN8_ANGAN